ncbi:ubiquinol-cytochrome c reductase complex 14 kDa protein [Talaromyces proteolyticus]|uniref:Cytochrome b-c1 complex subunit 7 n=1 Tax=Talaromyces proteolyticus TaxID=1131652 RepID=A0AAD4KQE7_9EURO|nr:ubiquinol-cytochrome c reductase complex 14 kDa protein [Talaromyces proteolyticus]KAH8693144.1 ubiquinol-cytochrome c reductase complex 14 kDa protein [Talaromyces proteolyticus]
MSVPSMTSYVVKRPYLRRWLQPIAEWYTNAAGYRRLGLRADDLIPEESELVQNALRRLPPKEAYDRVFRLRRAFQCSISHTLLPAEEQTKPDEDREYLSPIIRELQAEAQEREDLDTLVVKRK